MTKQNLGGIPIRRFILLTWLLTTLLSGIPGYGFAETNSATALTQTTWKLDDLFDDLQSWQTARRQVAAKLSQLSTCRNQLHTGAAALGQCLQARADAYRALLRVYTYSFLDKDVDLANSAAAERHSLAEDLYTRFAEETSFFKPELLAINRQTLRQWLDDGTLLNDHDFYIEDVLRQAKHVLSPAQEKILAAAGAPLRTAGETYSVLTNAEIPWPEVTLSTGKTVTLNPAGYTRHRSAPNRRDRQQVFDRFFGTFQDYRQTLATTLAGQVQANIFTARMRGYASAMEQALAVDNIPPQVYQTLVRSVNQNLPTLHRYLALRGRLLNLEEQRYYDVYPALGAAESTYTIADSTALLSRALRPLGADYQDLFRRAVNERWMHVQPMPGKRSGAYSMGAAYDVHPYILLNHNDDFESLTTFAHEWGHALHSVLANRAQPFSKAEYATFIAEIASIAHEILLYNELRNSAKTDEQRLFYLLQELQGLRGTFFRQTQFAEFELAIHETVENGGALSADKLAKLYGDTLRRYYGHRQGIMRIDESYAVEWAYIPHFYRNFYVYQYATSISAAYFLVEKIITGDTSDRKRYLAILKAGGSAYPYDILRQAGVDMAAPDVYQAVIRRCNALMDEVEALLAKRK